MVIGLAGPKLSGKGTAAAYFANNQNAQIYSMSGILTDITRRLHLSGTRANLITLASSLRAVFGVDILARVLKEDIRAAQDEIAVIDGIRYMEELRQFQQLKNFHLFYIDTPLKERYKRAQKRGEKVGEKEMSFMQFQEEEQAVTEQQITALQKYASVCLQNIDTIDTFYRGLEHEIKQLSALA